MGNVPQLIVMSIFGNGSSGGYSCTTIVKITKNLHILQKKKLQNKQIQDQFALINLTRVE